SIDIEATSKDGEMVKDIRYIELTNPKQKDIISPKYLVVNPSNKSIEPGEKTSLQFGSSATDVFVIQQIDKSTNQKPETRNYFILNNEKKTFEFSATEADRGGYGVNFFFIKHNRLYQHGEVINVPWTNKELQIEYASFRDNTLPGSKEQWKIKIKGYKNESVAAEMLASMYDVSLDQFYPHEWTKPYLWRTYSNRLIWNGSQNFTAVHSEQKWNNDDAYKTFEKVYDQFISNRFSRYGRLERSLEGRASGIVVQDAAAPTMNKQLNEQSSNYEMPPTSDSASTIKKIIVDNTGIQIRKNFNETAFFFPDLRTDKEGDIEFSFTLPEALTRWKFQAFSHTKELALGISQKEIITQKELMVQPNTPRFLRQGDRMEFTAKIVNLTDKEFTGQAQLELIDAVTNQSVDGWFQNIFPNQYFTVGAAQSEVVKFPIEIPFQFTSALVWRIVARAGNISDGEESAIPVLTNRMLVTETLAMPVRGSGAKGFSFEKLLNSVSGGTLQHHALTFEYTTNPAWYAVQALPYLTEKTNECAEQTWNRYYANSLAAMIANSSPRIQQIFSKWKTTDTVALFSNLQKNEELKSALLEETPWVLQAKTEAEQKKNIALLFDMVKMSTELKNSLEKLKDAQSPNGGFVWFKGGPDDRYMTQYIITGIGHLQKLKAIQKDQEKELQPILKSAIAYLDRKIKEDYDYLVRSKSKLNQQNISYIHVQYLYMRSFFPQHSVASASQTAYNYYHKQSQQFWMKGNKFMQGMAALSLNRTGDKQTPKAILKSLKETSINHDELGMYWKENSYGRSWFWWYAPIETQALLIEAFSEISNDQKTVDDLKTWLIKNKQTNNWLTTKATADACYAMLLQGTDWLVNQPTVTIKTGNTSFSNKEKEAEAGIGYFKKTIPGNFIKPEMGNIVIDVNQSKTSNLEQNNMPSWGAAYWQYFEDLDKITTASTPLQLNKKLFIEKNTDRGPVLTPVEEGFGLQVGDKLKVRIELRVDRDMEYVHMKDMRASALEPVNVLSGYKWQGGLGYYETTKDAATSFFFNYLRKGTYVFGYPLLVTHAGTFSNGITTIQCLYAPEFSAHSEGVRLSVE
ncbi:MAG: alpha-2-macroglobulin family protein, partial [Chitinophagaceae bacterium]